MANELAKELALIMLQHMEDAALKFKIEEPQVTGSRLHQFIATEFAKVLEQHMLSLVMTVKGSMGLSDERFRQLAILYYRDMIDMYRLSKED